MTPSFTCHFKRRESRLIAVCVRVPCALSVNHKNKKYNVSKGTHHAAVLCRKTFLKLAQTAIASFFEFSATQTKMSSSFALPYKYGSTAIYRRLTLNCLFTNEFATFRQMQCKAKNFFGVRSYAGKPAPVSSASLLKTLLKSFVNNMTQTTVYMQLPSKKVQMFFSSSTETLLLSVCSSAVPCGYSNDRRSHHPRIKGGLFVALAYAFCSLWVGLALGFTIVNAVPNTIHGVSLPQPSLKVEVRKGFF